MEIDDLTPRPAILAFARIMELVMRVKDAAGYPAWNTERIDDHLAGIRNETNEVEGALSDAAHSGFLGWDGEMELAQAVMRECADVANRAMMLANAVRPLCKHDGRGRAAVDADKEQGA